MIVGDLERLSDRPKLNFLVRDKSSQSERDEVASGKFPLKVLAQPPSQEFWSGTTAKHEHCCRDMHPSSQQASIDWMNDTGDVT